MTNDYSIADIAAVTRNNNDGGCGLGGGGGLVALIAVFLIVCLIGRGGFGGWGLGGFGGMGGGAPMAINYSGGMGSWGGCATAADVQRNFDTQTIINGIRNTQNGLCDGFYAQNTNLMQGFSGVQNTLAQGFAGINTALVQQGYETRNATQTIGSQLQQCCCDLRADLSGLNYNIGAQSADLGRAVERGFCETQYRDAANTTAIVQSTHNDTDRIIAHFDQRMDAYERSQHAKEMAEKDQKIFQLELRASQEAQNNYLVSKLTPPCPTAAYMVANPNGPLNYTIKSGCCNNCC